MLSDSNKSFLKRARGLYIDLKTAILAEKIGKDLSSLSVNLLAAANKSRQAIHNANRGHASGSNQSDKRSMQVENKPQASSHMQETKDGESATPDEDDDFYYVDPDSIDSEFKGKYAPPKKPSLPAFHGESLFPPSLPLCVLPAGLVRHVRFALTYHSIFYHHF